MGDARDGDVDLYKRALQCLERDDLDSAHDCLTRAIARNGGVAWYHHTLGEICERQGRLPAARQAYAQALRLNPVSSKYRQAMARVSVQQAGPTGEIGMPPAAAPPGRGSGSDPEGSSPARSRRDEGGPPAPAPHRAEQAVQGNGSAPAEALVGAQEKPRLLVVEDSEVTRTWYNQVLRREYQLSFANTARGAMRALPLVRPALILLDWQLEDDRTAPSLGQGARDAAGLLDEVAGLSSNASGLDVCKQIKRSAFRSIPVLMLTSKKGLLDKTLGKIARADRYLTKPVTADHLQATIRELLARAAEVGAEMAPGVVDPLAARAADGHGR